MNFQDKHKIIGAAIKARFLHRLKEQRTDLALAVQYSYRSSTEGIHAILASRPPLSRWENYESVRQMLDTDPVHFKNEGLAGAQGNYWSLTEEGQALLEDSFEHQLLEAQ